MAHLEGDLEGSLEGSPRATIEIASKRNAIASRLADSIDAIPYDEWVDYVDKLRGEGIGDIVIDMAAGQTIDRFLSGHVEAPRGYFMTIARDWFQQRTGHEANTEEAS